MICSFPVARTGAGHLSNWPVANTGRHYKDAYQFALDKINAAGGVKIGQARRGTALYVALNDIVNYLVALRHRGR